ncbi:MAG TPA: T9SS type A sorting domain-containing protein [Saprospiraceae bacterium]|nr:T9SS type A sorting domain-containing protein [Saprospiraceae bacterium]
MKNLFILLVIFILLINHNLSAQQNLPLKFKDDFIKWSELSWMEGQSSNDQFVHFSSPPIIDKDTIFLFMNYYQKELENGKNYGYCGYIIKKVNKNSGEKYWETKRMFKEFGDRKIISQPQFVGNTIELSLYDEVRATAYGTDWYECYPAHVVLDKSSGEIIDSIFVDKTNTQLPKLRSIGGELYYYIGSTVPTIFKTKEGYIHMRSSLKEILSSNCDLNGNLVSVDSIKYPTYKYVPWDIRFEQVENDSFWVLMLNRAQNWADVQALFSKYDMNLNLNKTVDVSQHIAKPITSAGIYFIDKGYFVVGTNYVDPVAMTDKYHSYLFDNNGQFLDSISYTLRPGIDDIIRYGWLRPMVDRVNNRLLMSQSRQDKLTESTYFELYANEGVAIKSVSSIEVEGIKDHFRTYYSTMLDNGDILLYIEQFTDPGPSGDRWYSWIMLDGQKMNIISSTKDVPLNTNHFKIYPNPSNNIIHIDGLQAEANVQVQNINGQVLKRITTLDGQVDISDLTSGLYIFEIQNKDVKERHKVIKIE